MLRLPGSDALEQFGERFEVRDGDRQAFRTGFIILKYACPGLDKTSTAVEFFTRQVACQHDQIDLARFAGESAYAPGKILDGEAPLRAARRSATSAGASSARTTARMSGGMRLNRARLRTAIG